MTELTNPHTSLSEGHMRCPKCKTVLDPKKDHHELDDEKSDGTWVTHMRAHAFLRARTLASLPPPCYNIRYTQMERSMTNLKITAVGNSLGIILPREVLQMLRASKGDTIHITEAPGGGIILTPYDPDFAAIMAAAETVMAEDREALRQLAK